MDYKRLFWSAIGGWVIGLVLAIFVGFFTDKTIAAWIMLPVIIGGGVATWFFLKNNKKIEDKFNGI
jgi:uncharacterized membrane protein